jgi:hypothetical protein
MRYNEKSALPPPSLDVGFCLHTHHLARRIISVVASSSPLIPLFLLKCGCNCVGDDPFRNRVRDGALQAIARGNDRLFVSAWPTQVTMPLFLSFCPTPHFTTNLKREVADGIRFRRFNNNNGNLRRSRVVVDLRSFLFELRTFAAAQNTNKIID